MRRYNVCGLFGFIGKLFGPALIKPSVLKWWFHAWMPIIMDIERKMTLGIYIKSSRVGSYVESFTHYEQNNYRYYYWITKFGSIEFFAGIWLRCLDTRVDTLRIKGGLSFVTAVELRADPAGLIYFGAGRDWVSARLRPGSVIIYIDCRTLRFSFTLHVLISSEQSSIKYFFASLTCET